MVAPATLTRIVRVRILLPQPERRPQRRRFFRGVAQTVARLVRDQEARSSNLLTPTTPKTAQTGPKRPACAVFSCFCIVPGISLGMPVLPPDRRPNCSPAPGFGGDILGDRGFRRCAARRAVRFLSCACGGQCGILKKRYVKTQYEKTQYEKTQASALRRPWLKEV